MPGEHTARPPPALHAPRPPAYNRTQQLSSTLRPTLAEETKREVEHSATTAAETKREAERERDGWISLRTQRFLLANSIKEMMQPCLIHLHVVSLVLLHPSSSTKEMMRPCLIHLRIISLVAPLNPSLMQATPTDTATPCASTATLPKR